MYRSKDQYLFTNKHYYEESAMLYVYILIIILYVSHTHVWNTTYYFWDRIFELEILMNLHVLRTSEFKHHFRDGLCVFMSMCMCFCLSAKPQNKL